MDFANGWEWLGPEAEHFPIGTDLGWCDDINDRFFQITVQLRKRYPFSRALGMAASDQLRAVGRSA